MLSRLGAAQIIPFDAVEDVTQNRIQPRADAELSDAALMIFLTEV
jgi:predicted kinase